MFPKMGNLLHSSIGELEFAGRIAEALNAELGPSHRAIKTVMRWTDASERTVKHWLSATHAPHAANLVALAQHSDSVFEAFFTAAHREDLRIGIEVHATRTRLRHAVQLLDEVLQTEGEGRARRNADP